jgi:hypothetical protein
MFGNNSREVAQPCAGGCPLPGIYLLYLLTRGLVFAGDGATLANAGRVIGLEQSLGLFREPAW